MPLTPPLPNTLLVSACVLSLASNVNPNEHLAMAKKWLNELGEMVLSEVYISDNTQCPDYYSYHNQIAYLQFTQPLAYQDLVKVTKQFEQTANRGQYDKPLVTLDIDIVAIQTLTHTLTSDLVDEKGKNFLTFDGLPDWLGVARRFPLASYDRMGIESLKFLQEIL